jgi:hypothetical protein
MIKFSVVDPVKSFGRDCIGGKVSGGGLIPLFPCSLKGTVGDWKQGILHTFHSIAIIKNCIFHMHGAEFWQIFMWWAGTVGLLSASANRTICLSMNGSNTWL